MDAPLTPPRLLVLTSTFPRWQEDWEPRFVLDLCRALAERFTIHVVAPHHRDAALHEVWDGIEIHRFRYFPARLQSLAYDGGILAKLRGNPLHTVQLPGFLAAQWATARRLLRTHAFSAIHAHWLIPQGPVALALQRTTGVPAICTAHGGDLFALHRAGLDGLIRAIASRCRAVTVVSQAMRATLSQIGHGEAPVEVIPMGTDLHGIFYPDPAVPRAPCTVLYVGRLVDKKGVDVLIEAFALLARTHPEARLDIAGFGPAEPLLHARVRRLDLGDRVRFLGAVAHAALPDRLRRATLAVVPSVVAKSGDQEGFGLVIAEAMGCGCPVVASDLPAVRDLVEDEVTGLLARSDDAHHLAQRIAVLLDQPTQRARLADAARAFVTSRYDWPRIGAQYGEVIERAIAAQASARRHLT